MAMYYFYQKFTFVLLVTKNIICKYKYYNILSNIEKEILRNHQN